jgi:hypothetical protein
LANLERVAAYIYRKRMWQDRFVGSIGWEKREAMTYAERQEGLDCVGGEAAAFGLATMTASGSAVVDPFRLRAVIPHEYCDSQVPAHSNDDEVWLYC